MQDVLLQQHYKLAIPFDAFKHVMETECAQYWGQKERFQQIFPGAAKLWVTTSESRLLYVFGLFLVGIVGSFGVHNMESEKTYFGMQLIF